VPNYSI